tara:strand:- start:2096 stop:2617 length:522 start_codon:yes stop_codon:yes gene_type:complete
MALITCPDCNQEISDAAPSCIKCGRPMETKSIVQPSNDEIPTDSTAQVSLKSNQWQHPISKEIITISNAAWLWALLFGGFYLAYKGHAGQGILWIILALFTVGIAWVVLPFMVKGILEKDLIKNGWIRGGNAHLAKETKTYLERTREQKQQDKRQIYIVIFVLVVILLYAFLV